MAPSNADREVASRALDRDQMRAYAQFQLAQVGSVLVGHGPASGGSCRCGRPAPCHQQEFLQGLSDRYTATLAMLDQTVALPVVAALAQPERRRWQWLTGFFREVL